VDMAEPACGRLILESIVGGDASVGDVLEVEVVIPWGEEGVCVAGGDYAPLVLADGESLCPSCEAGVRFMSHMRREDAREDFDRSFVLRGSLRVHSVFVWEGKGFPSGAFVPGRC
jgi:hypothetical protein